jgi:hypothetical protein
MMGATMPNEGPSEKQILQAALGPGDDCVPVEQLERFVIEGSTPPAPLAEHAKSCRYCQTQIQLLREFGAGTLRETETEAVRLIAARLRARSNEVFRATRAQVDEREPWWRAFLRAPWLSPAALAFAGILVVVAISLQMRNAPPGLRPPRPDQEVLRSNTISVIAPSGDIQQAPGEIRWQAAPNAVRYEVRLLEVDGAELWKGETPENRIELPAAVRARVVPAKTLLCQVLAFDASGHRVAQSETVRFRLLQ